MNYTKQTTWGSYGGHMKRIGNQLEARDSGDISKFRKKKLN